MGKELSADIKERLFIETYHITKREEMISDIAYLEKTNQMLVFRLSGHDELLHQDCGYVTNQHLRVWGIGIEELERAAWENMMEKRPPVMVEIEDAVFSNFSRNLLEAGVNVLEGIAPELQRFVLTNRYCEHGASYMWNAETMETVADKLGGNVIIVPVSINELFVALEADATTADWERDKLHELNERGIQVWDYLSNEVYRYDREKKEVAIVPENSQTATMIVGM